MRPEVKPNAEARLDPGVAILGALLAAKVLLHTLTNGQYGFHRDELATIDDARRLAWGYVAYPPLTPAIGRLAMEMFGATPAGVRFFAALAQSIAILLAALMAREFCGTRRAQFAAAAMAVAAARGIAGGESLFPVCRVRLPVVGADGVPDDPPAAVGGPALVDGHRRVDRRRTCHQVHRPVPGRRGGRRGGADTGAPLPAQPMVVAGRRGGAVDLPPNAIWQVPARLHVTRFPARHSRARCAHRADLRLSSRSVPDYPLIHSRSRCGRRAWPGCSVLRRPTVPGSRLDVVVPLALFVIARGRGYYMAPAYPMLLAAAR